MTITDEPRNTGSPDAFKITIEHDEPVTDRAPSIRGQLNFLAMIDGKERSFSFPVDKDHNNYSIRNGKPYNMLAIYILAPLLSDIMEALSGVDSDMDDKDTWKSTYYRNPLKGDYKILVSGEIIIETADGQRLSKTNIGKDVRPPEFITRL